METAGQNVARPVKWRVAEVTLVVYVLAALALLVPIIPLLDSPFPVFTMIWLLVPLITAIRYRDARRVGWRLVPAPEFLKVTAACLAAMLFLAALVEPWSHTYRLLLQMATAGPRLDSTFAWLMRFPGIAGWAAMLLHTGLVTILAEELFFRGWLLQFLLRGTGRTRAVPLQAFLFTLPQLLPSVLMPGAQAVIYAVVYSWLAVGVVGGWAAARTSSILPSVVAATLFNYLLTALLL